MTAVLVLHERGDTSGTVTYGPKPARLCAGLLLKMRYQNTNREVRKKIADDFLKIGRAHV